MADSGVQDNDQATPTLEQEPRATSEKGAVESGNVTPAPVMPEVSGGEQGAIRSAFLARVAAQAAAPAGTSLSAEAAAEGLALRRAYLAHLSEGMAEAAGDRELPGGDVLRSTYVTHAVGGRGPQAGPGGRAKRSARVGRKETALSRERKSATRKPKKGASARQRRKAARAPARGRS